MTSLPEDWYSSDRLDKRLFESQILFDHQVNIWRASPELAKQAGRKAEELMMSLDQVQKRYAEEWNLSI